MLLDGRALWLAQTNAWVLARESGGPTVVIDAPPDLDGIAALLHTNDLYPVASILTHGHLDHMGAARGLEETYGIATYVHPDDDYLTLDPLGQLRALVGGMLPGEWTPPTERRSLAHGSRLELAGIDLEVLHTPGHTPGHCCLYLAEEGWLFSGDQLFAGSIGRTDLPGGNLNDLAISMRDHVMSLPDETRVLPGHGPETTVGHERRTNPFRELWLGRTGQSR